MQSSSLLSPMPGCSCDKHDYSLRSATPSSKANKISGQHLRSACLEDPCSNSRPRSRHKAKDAQVSTPHGSWNSLPLLSEKSISMARNVLVRSARCKPATRPKPPQLEAVTRRPTRQPSPTYPRNLALPAGKTPVVLARMGQLDQAATEFSTCAEQRQSRRSPCASALATLPRTPRCPSRRWLQASRSPPTTARASTSTTWAVASFSSTSGLPGAVPATPSFRTLKKIAKEFSQRPARDHQHQLG